MKKCSKKLTAVLLAVIIMLGALTAMPISAFAAESGESVGTSSGTTGDCTWTIDDEGTLTISGNGEMKSNGQYERTNPWGTEIKKVVIEDGVTSIGSFAFCNCTDLTSVSIGSGVKVIREFAFDNCVGLKKVKISDLDAWYDIQFCCRRSEDVDAQMYIPYPDNTYSAHPAAYGADLYLNGEIVRDLVIPSNLTEIKDYTFYGCNSIESVTIPDGVKSIGAGAFARTGITSIDIPNSVENIGASAFDRTAWYKNQPNGMIYIGNIAYEYKGAMPKGTVIEIKDGTKIIASYAFHGYDNLTGIIIPDSLEKIEYRAFWWCSNIKKIYISDIAAWCNISYDSFGIDLGYGISYPISYGAVMYLNGEIIRDLIIPYGVETINDYAFYGLCGLTSVTIPDSVTSIGGSAFSACSNLTIYGYEGSYAEIYAMKENIPFVVITLGDLNGDGAVDISDATEIQRALGEFDDSIDLTDGIVIAAADVNKDNKVSIRDVTEIQRFCAEIITSFE